jgi:hypothetical protein
MQNKIKILAFLFIMCILAACSPDQFIIKSNSGDQIPGVILSGLDGVQTPDELNIDNALLLKEGGIAAIRRSKLTQFTADFTVNVMQGEGIRFSIRNISDHPENHPAINFDYMLKGSMVSGTGVPDLFVDSVKAELNKPARVKILNLGKVLTITVNCDTVYNTKVELPATEYMVFKALGSARVMLTGIEFIDEKKTE